MGWGLVVFEMRLPTLKGSMTWWYFDFFCSALVSKIATKEKKKKCKNKIEGIEGTGTRPDY